MLQYTNEFTADSFPAWGQAREILDRILEEGKGEALEYYLQDIFCGDELPREVDINDFLAYEWETIYKDLGIRDEDEDEDEDDDEDEDEDDSESDSDSEPREGTAIEICPFCGEEVILGHATQFISEECPSCGKRILPCSLCSEEDMKHCNLCPANLRKENQNGF